jgi:lipopolysaccharide transport system permease protein
MVLWTVASTTLFHGARALQITRRLIGKLATPKLVFLLASGAVPVCFSLIFAVLLAGLLVFEYLVMGKLYLRLDWPLMLCPIPILFSFLLCIGICSFISVALLVARDARYVIPLLTQFLFYLTPVMYSLEIMPPSWRLAISYLNPLASLIEFFRWTLFGVGTWEVLSLMVAIGISLGVFLLGARFLMLCEWAVADVIEAGRL